MYASIVHMEVNAEFALARAWSPRGAVRSPWCRSRPPDDPWGRTGRTAAGILLLVAVVVVLVGTARRRIAVRRDVPGAVEEAADLHRPVPEMPTARLDT
jgi:hypothetical protein